MIRAGLCSVTFRALAADEVIDVAVRAGLEAIEWGGDVHVPLGDLDAAVRVGEATRAAGLATASYGSYVVAGQLNAGEVDALFDTASALGAPHVRVWCRGGVGDLRALGTAGEACGVRVSTEFHPGTSTETAASTIELLDAVPGVATYWQPHPLLDDDENVAELRRLGDRVSHLHVFSWRSDGTRLPLAGKADLWRSVFAEVGPGDRIAFLEFVEDDDVDRLLHDAATLRSWL